MDDPTLVNPASISDPVSWRFPQLFSIRAHLVTPRTRIAMRLFAILNRSGSRFSPPGEPPELSCRAMNGKPRFSANTAKRVFLKPQRLRDFFDRFAVHLVSPGNSGADAMRNKRKPTFVYDDEACDFTLRRTGIRDPAQAQKARKYNVGLVLQPQRVWDN